VERVLAESLAGSPLGDLAFPVTPCGAKNPFTTPSNQEV
jgi:hypothetical protein